MSDESRQAIFSTWFRFNDTPTWYECEHAMVCIYMSDEIRLYNINNV